MILPLLLATFMHCLMFAVFDPACSKPVAVSEQLCYSSLFT